MRRRTIKTWVKQVRDVAYIVEDCLQDLAVRLGKPSWWWTLVDRHRVATRMKELRAKVEDVSQRNVRYRLIKGSGPKPATGIFGATMFGIEEARRQKDKSKVDLSQLIVEGNEDLRVIATIVIKGAYDNLKRSKKFKLYAWIRIVRPFNPLEFLKPKKETNIGAQVLKKMGVMKQDDLVDAFSEHVNEKSYLIVLNDLSTIEEEVINLILKQDDQQPMVISVWGMGDLGKTTLIKEVYQSQELSGLFEMRACVTIMHPFVFEEELKLDDLHKLLERKRSLIILDDLSSIAEWDMIIQSLPKMENASRIVITTREENIAKHCSTKQGSIYKLEVLENKDALDLFTKKWHHDNQLPSKSMASLKGSALAIVTIGGFLAKQPKTPMEWRKLNEYISAELEMNLELGTIRTILMKIILPEDYNISRRRLVHRWNAEGYSSDVRGKSKGEVADNYFMELIHRSMILPVKESVGSRKVISSCKLHDLMREISISKAMEENLVSRMEEGCTSNTQGTIRHLAISSNWEGDQSEFESTVDLSRIRSLTVFGEWKPFYISGKMRLLRVLDLESTTGRTTGLVDHHLEPTGKLLHLKYLSLRGCDVLEELPKQMRNKLCVWSLVLMAFCFSSCSLKFGKRDGCTFWCSAVFPFLASLADPRRGVVVPRGLGKLKALHTLGVVNVGRGKAIKRLTRLRNLAVSGINKKNCQEFCSTLEHLIRHLESLQCTHERRQVYVDDLRPPPKNLQSLKLWGTLGKLPEWVAGLQNLVRLKLECTRTNLTEADGTVQVLWQATKAHWSQPDKHVATPGHHHNNDRLHMSSATPVKLAIPRHAGLPYCKPDAAGPPPPAAVSHDHRHYQYCQKLSWVPRNDASKKGTTPMTPSSPVQNLNRVFT
ncbi:hypothetical protein SETIT_2G077300v2 [Setaria italica]|uniref:NB-ARC domain-containing protein n=1 Tax=Setaria italica TaxID=4555 RepID=A0A368PYE7_SETIT|nr:hypothetical protein SETIT_2G077300v2 [Setaria italica]